jgi:ATP-dependent helicase/nuclease subunit B
MPLDPLLTDPGPAERGTLFHAILHRFSASGVDPRAPQALGTLLEAGRVCFVEADLPGDVAAVWWPRFERMAPEFLAWERDRADGVLSRHPELRAEHMVADTGVLLTGYADRIDRLTGGMADIIDYKSGTSPSKTQAHRLVAPQLALEAALLRREAFAGLGRLEPSDLLYVRLKANGQVVPESVISIKDSVRTAADLGKEAWERLARLLKHYELPATGYLSRALPFRAGDVDGDYDHLARVLEWSAGRREGTGE